MTARQIMKDVARQHMVEVGVLRGPSRLKHHVAARIEAAKALVGRGLTYGQVGLLLNRDASTIAYHTNERIRARKLSDMRRRWRAV